MVVNVVLTRKIQKAISDVRNLDETPQELLDRLSEYCVNDNGKNLDQNEDTKECIEFSVVREVWQILKKNSLESGDSSPVYLHELLEGSDLYVPPPKLPEKNPQLVARLKKLQAQHERSQYDAMVTNLGPKYEASKELGMTVRTTSKELSSVVNFLCSVVAAFMFGLVASQYAFPSLAIRVIIGIIVACIVAIAEMYFMARSEI